MTEAQKLKLIDGWEVVIGIEIHTFSNLITA